jgi:molecular chaperone DnaK
LDKDIEELKPKLEVLKSTVNEITTELYKNATPPPGSEQQTEGGPQEQTAGEQQEQAAGEQKSESSTDETKNN